MPSLPLGWAFLGLPGTWGDVDSQGMAGKPLPVGAQEGEGINKPTGTESHRGSGGDGPEQSGTEAGVMGDEPLGGLSEEVTLVLRTGQAGLQWEGLGHLLGSRDSTHKGPGVGKS